MKWIGLLILAVGIGLAASYGARVTPKVEEQLTLAGATQFRGAEIEKAFAEYCAAREEAGLPAADACPVEGEQPPPPAEEEEEEEDRAPPTYEELVASGRAQLEAKRTTQEVLTGDVLTKREAWLSAMQANIEPSAAAATAETPGPEERLSAWGSQSGAMFGLGLALIVIGAFIGRVAVKREAMAEPAAGTKDAPAKDFGKVLDELQATVRKLADEANGIAEPKREDFDRIKGEIEQVQLEAFEPLIAARTRVQVKHGMAGFAEIFGPLSSAERKVNRAWSAVVDKHWPEAQASLQNAAVDLEESHRILDGLTSTASPRS